MIQARHRVAAAARDAGIHWGSTSATPAHSRALVEAGARFICHGADILFVKRALEQVQQEYGALGFTFDNRLGAMAAELQDSV
jgi:2-keto-3-deoxy-L-rhamnonate aldolase RhmA